MSEITELVSMLSNFTTSTTWPSLSQKFEAQSNVSHIDLDCLKIFQLQNTTSDDIMYGLYHHMDSAKETYSIRLASNFMDSLDQEWTHLAFIDERASMPAIWVNPDNTLLMAYEVTGSPKGDYIRLRYYESVLHLQNGQFKDEHDIDKSFSISCEGTPSFESVTINNGNIRDSEISMRFHFYEDMVKDQQARGTLTNWSDWRSEQSTDINKVLQSLGFLGNLGGRSKFNFRGSSYYLQETQITNKDWASWRITLCDSDGMPLQTLPIETPQHSTSFANPNVTPII